MIGFLFPGRLLGLFFLSALCSWGVGVGAAAVVEPLGAAEFSGLLSSGLSGFFPGLATKFGFFLGPESRKGIKGNKPLGSPHCSSGGKDSWVLGEP